MYWKIDVEKVVGLENNNAAHVLARSFALVNINLCEHFPTLFRDILVQ